LDSGAGERCLDPRSARRQVVIVRERLGDQGVELGIAEGSPPGLLDR
jgi:hypothetical protein